MDRIEGTILSSFVHDQEYARKVSPYIREEFFEDSVERKVYKSVYQYLVKYDDLPKKDAVVIQLKNDRKITDKEYEEAKKLIGSLYSEKKEANQWLIDQTEIWCQERAITNAIFKSVEILEGNAKKLDKGAIPNLLSDALAVSFDPNVGHDYVDQKDDRFKFYHEKEEKFPLGLSYFNKITNGGLPRKTLNIIMAGTGVGKTLFMCDAASHFFKNGKNVLYITMEMAEERIAERIDANLLNIPLDDLKVISEKIFNKRVEQVCKGITSKLIIKEYPTGAANTNHFKNLLNELNLKKSFKPDVIFIDYINICSSSRIRQEAGMYQYVKTIAEELRGLAVEADVPLITATQINRDGYSSSNPDLTDTAESFGLPHTADFMVAITRNEELDELGQYQIIQLKNRYGDVSKRRRGIIGVDKTKMRLYNVEESAEKLADEGTEYGKHTKRTRTNTAGKTEGWNI